MDVKHHVYLLTQSNRSGIKTLRVGRREKETNVTAGNVITGKPDHSRGHYGNRKAPVLCPHTNGSVTCELIPVLGFRRCSWGFCLFVLIVYVCACARVCVCVCAVSYTHLTLPTMAVV